MRPRQNAATVCAARHPGVNEDRVKDSPSQDTIVIAAVLAADKVLTACVGDSRAYRARDGNPELLADEHEDTTPRPAVADALDRAASAEELRAGPESLPWALAHRNFLLAALGDDVEAAVREHAVATGDLIVLTSDGVHDNLTHREMQAVLSADGNDGPQSLCTELVTLAQRRSRDFEHLRQRTTT